MPTRDGSRAAELIDIDARAVDAVRRAGGNPQELVLLTQMDLHLRTIVGEMSRLMQTNDVRAEDAATLARNIEGFALARSAVLDGNPSQGISPVRTPEARSLIQQAARAPTPSSSRRSMRSRRCRRSTRRAWPVARCSSAARS